MKNIKLIKILFITLITLLAIAVTSNVTSSEVSKSDIRNNTKSNNTTINTYLHVMADYSEEEVNEFFASRNVTDDTVIFAPKNSKGGFFLFEGDNTVITNEHDGIVTTVDAKAPNQSATVGEIKEALKENNS